MQIYQICSLIVRTFGSQGYDAIDCSGNHDTVYERRVGYPLMCNTRVTCKRGSDGALVICDTTMNLSSRRSKVSVPSYITFGDRLYCARVHLDGGSSVVGNLLSYRDGYYENVDTNHTPVVVHDTSKELIERLKLSPLYIMCNVTSVSVMSYKDIVYYVRVMEVCMYPSSIALDEYFKIHFRKN